MPTPPRSITPTTTPPSLIRHGRDHCHVAVQVADSVARAARDGRHATYAHHVLVLDLIGGDVVGGEPPYQHHI
jgi:hypothetical protein